MVVKRWYIYLVECSDGSFYTGITNDLENRMKAHSQGKGSKYVRAKGFGKLLKSKELESHSVALKEELKLKKLKRFEKLEYFN